MVGCFAPDCKHFSDKYECRFFKFPKDPQRLRKWIDLVRREDLKPKLNSSRLCSCHFVNGDRKNDPSIFHRNIDKLLDLPSDSAFSPKRRKVVEKSEKSHQESDVAKALEFNAPCSPSTEMPDIHPPESDLPKTSPNSIDMIMLQCENYHLQREVERLTKIGCRFSLERIKDNDSKIMYYTGFPNYELLQLFLQLFEKTNVVYYLGWSVKKISREDQICMTLIKLRLNLGHLDLAEAFNCSVSLVTNVVITWIHVLNKILQGYLTPKIPSTRKNQNVLPNAFSSFPNCRIILDCTEVYVQVPSNLENQRETWSGYKHHNTFKGLVGVAPNGALTFASDLYPGSTSDKDIVKHCGILDQLEPGDLVLADKGFLISDILPQGVHLNIPPFLCTSQFTNGEVEQGKAIAKARIHVERVIRRVKCYDILKNIPQDYFPYANEIWQLCAALTNFRFPLIRELEEKYSKLDEMTM